MAGRVDVASPGVGVAEGVLVGTAVATLGIMVGVEVFVDVGESTRGNVGGTA